MMFKNSPFWATCSTGIQLRNNCKYKERKKLFFITPLSSIELCEMDIFFYQFSIFNNCGMCEYVNFNDQLLRCVKCWLNALYLSKFTTLTLINVLTSQSFPLECFLSNSFFHLKTLVIEIMFCMQFNCNYK